MLTDQDWEDLKVAYKMVSNKDGFSAEWVDTKLDSGAMSTIYKTGRIVRIDIKEEGS